MLAKDASIDHGKNLLDICGQHGWLTFQDDLLNLFENTSNETVERHVRMLADWSQCKDRNADRGQLCSLLAQRIMSAFGAGPHEKQNAIGEPRKSIVLSSCPRWRSRSSVWAKRNCSTD